MYWENPTGEDITVRLSTVGFYKSAKEFHHDGTTGLSNCQVPVCPDDRDRFWKRTKCDLARLRCEILRRRRLTVTTRNILLSSVDSKASPVASYSGDRRSGTWQFESPGRGRRDGIPWQTCRSQQLIGERLCPRRSDFPSTIHGCLGRAPRMRHAFPQLLPSRSSRMCPSAYRRDRVWKLKITGAVAFHS